MSKTLKQHFPMIRDRLELQMEIESNPDLNARRSVLNRFSRFC